MPQTKWVLLDAQAKRVRFLQSVIAAWHEEHRVECVLGRAEELYWAGKTGLVDIIVARGFGPPSVTAECASPLLQRGGVLVVSEPPASDGSRWHGVDRAGLGLVYVGVERRRGFGYALLHKQEDHHRDIPRPTATLVRKLLF
jgi:16S rRNA (guanine527-N7)-methyltransferase